MANNRGTGGQCFALLYKTPIVLFQVQLEKVSDDQNDRDIDFTSYCYDTAFRLGSQLNGDEDLDRQISLLDQMEKLFRFASDMELEQRAAVQRKSAAACQAYIEISSTGEADQLVIDSETSRLANSIKTCLECGLSSAAIRLLESAKETCPELWKPHRELAALILRLAGIRSTQLEALTNEARMYPSGEVVKTHYCIEKCCISRAFAGLTESECMSILAALSFELRKQQGMTLIPASQLKYLLKELQLLPKWLGTVHDETLTEVLEGHQHDRPASLSQVQMEVDDSIVDALKLAWETMKEAGEEEEVDEIGAFDKILRERYLLGAHVPPSDEPLLTIYKQPPASYIRQRTDTSTQVLFAESISVFEDGDLSIRESVESFSQAFYGRLMLPSLPEHLSEHRMSLRQPSDDDDESSTIPDELTPFYPFDSSSRTPHPQMQTQGRHLFTGLDMHNVLFAGGSVLKALQQDRVPCHHCKEAKLGVQACGKCKRVFFCSRKCQVKQPSEHFHLTPPPPLIVCYGRSILGAVTKSFASEAHHSSTTVGTSIFSYTASTPKA